MAYVEVDDRDARIQYSDGWEVSNAQNAYDGTLHAAQVTGLTATFKFTGKQISVFGCGGATNDNGWPSTAYDIDGHRYKVLTPDRTASPDTLFYNVTFFEADDLEPGPHTLVITNLNGTAPNLFWFDWISYLATDFVVEPTSGSAGAQATANVNATSSGASSTDSSAATASLPASTTDSAGLSASASVPAPSASNVGDPQPTVSGKSQNLGAIIGGTVGGVVFLAALAVLGVYFFLKRRYSQQREGPVHRIQRDKPSNGQLGRSRTLFRLSAPPPSSITPSGLLLPSTAAEAAGLLPYSDSASSSRTGSRGPPSQGPSTSASTSEPARSQISRFRSMHKQRPSTPELFPTPTSTPSASNYGEPVGPAVMHEIPETVLSLPPAYTPD